jgi:hypothetical protein
MVIYIILIWAFLIVLGMLLFKSGKKSLPRESETF